MLIKKLFKLLYLLTYKISLTYKILNKKYIHRPLNKLALINKLKCSKNVSILFK